MDITLIGGGWDVPAQTACLSPFLATCAARAGGVPRIGMVWVDEGDTEYGARWPALLRSVAEVEPVDVAVPIGSTLDAARIDDVDGIFVCGGLTPAYAEALAPAAAAVRDAVLVRGVPYAGSSAGAAVAARDAVVGGYLDGDVVVCPPDSAEDLDAVTVVAGLGLVDESVDVHASAWGTLPRLASALRRLPEGAAGIALDEDTAWRVSDAGSQVLGRNRVHLLAADADAVRWRTRAAGG